MSKKQSEETKARMLIVTLVNIMREHEIPIENGTIVVRDDKGNPIGKEYPILELVEDALNFLEKIDPNKIAVLSNPPEEKSNEQQNPKRYI